MNKLKEIGNKYYQEVEVVMLATNKKATDKPFSTGITLCNDGKLRIGNPVGKSESRQHLYFLSNREITCGDWFYNTTTRIIHECTEVNNNICSGKNSGEYHGKFECKKIIATTDESLVLCNNTAFAKLLPQPSHKFILAFIKAYNEDNPIIKVLIEYEEWHKAKMPINFLDYTEPGSRTPIIKGSEKTYYKLKLNSSNEITIKKVKDSWTREEVKQMLADFLTDCWNKDYQFNGLAHDEVANIYIEENL